MGFFDLFGKKKEVQPKEYVSLVDDSKKGNIPRELYRRIEEFCIVEIGGKIMDGITYALIKDEERVIDEDAKKSVRQKHEEYQRLAQECKVYNFENGMLFEAYKVAIGYIYTVNSNIAQDVLEAVIKHSNGKMEVLEFPKIAKERSIKTLADYVYAQFQDGTMEFEVALYCTSLQSRIKIYGVTPEGEHMCVDYHAFAITKEEIEQVNDILIKEYQIRIRLIQPYEILPQVNGVSFLLCLETMQEYMQKQNQNQQTINSDNTSDAMKKILSKRIPSVIKTIRDTDIEDNICALGEKFHIEYGVSVKIQINGKIYDVKMNNSVKGRIDGMGQLYEENHIMVGMQGCFNYAAENNTIFLEVLSD